MNRRQVLGYGAAAGALGFAGGPPLAEPSDLLTPILKDSGVPALAGAVFDAAGTVFLQVAGVRRAGSADAVTAADRWHIGSNTKAMTALLHARLCDLGRMKREATLAELFDGPVDAALSALTMADLMAHRSGLDDAIALNAAWLLFARTDPRSLAAQRMALARAVLTVEPARADRGFHYANINFILAGAAIERAMDGAWEDIIRAELFDPLGMGSAGFGAPKGQNPWGHRGGSGHDPDGLSDNPAALGPAGTVHVALEDYGKFLRLFLTEGGGLIAPATMAATITPPPGDAQTYRDGWMFVPGVPGLAETVLGHDGSNTLWYTTALLAPKRGRAFVAFTNDGDRGQAAASRLVLALVQRFGP